MDGALINFVLQDGMMCFFFMFKNVNTTFFPDLFFKDVMTVCFCTKTVP